MSNIADINGGVCQAIQRTLLNQFECNAMQRTSTGLLDSLVSNSMTQKVNQLSTDGKNRQIELTYMQRITPDEVEETDPTNFCDASSSTVVKSIFVEPTLAISEKELLTSEQLRAFCMEPYNNKMGFIGEIMSTKFDAMAVKADRLIGAKLVSNIGKFYDGSTSKVWTPISGGNEPNIIGEAQALAQYRKIGCNGRPILIGNGDMEVYTGVKNIGCCNQYGVDLSQASGSYSFFLDYELDGVFNNAKENYVLYYPGAFQWVQYNRYNASNAVINSFEERTNVTDPWTGLRYDLVITRDSCTDSWAITISLVFDLVFLPQDLYKSGDPLYETNGILHFTNS